MRPADWERARADLHTLEAAPDFDAAAAVYFDRHKKYPPDYLHDSGRKRSRAARRAFGDGDGWAPRLVMTLDTPALHSLHAEHLGLSPSVADPRLLLAPTAAGRAFRAIWTDAINRHYSGPRYFKLERGWHGRVHCHLLADLWDGPPELPRDGKIIEPCYDFEGAVGYMLKPALKWNTEHLAQWLEARATGRRLPRLSGTANLPNSRTLASPVPPCLFCLRLQISLNRTPPQNQPPRSHPPRPIATPPRPADARAPLRPRPTRNPSPLFDWRHDEQANRRANAPAATMTGDPFDRELDATMDAVCTALIAEYLALELFDAYRDAGREPPPNLERDFRAALCQELEPGRDREHARAAVAAAVSALDENNGLKK